MERARLGKVEVAMEFSRGALYARKDLVAWAQESNMTFRDDRSKTLSVVGDLALRDIIEYESFDSSDRHQRPNSMRQPATAPQREAREILGKIHDGDAPHKRILTTQCLPARKKIYRFFGWSSIFGNDAFRAYRSDRASLKYRPNAGNTNDRPCILGSMYSKIVQRPFSFAHHLSV